MGSQPGGSESGPEWSPVLIFDNSWDTSFGRNAIVEFDSVVKKAREGVAEFISITRADAKKSLNARAISCGLLT